MPNFNNPTQVTIEEVVALKERDMLDAPGFAPAFTPEEAEYAGAFVEHALSVGDLDDEFDGVTP